MRLVMEMWYACMFVCVNVWWYKHILLYVFIFIHLYIYIYIFSCIFISIMCYLICFGSDLFCIYLRGIVLGMISRFQSAKSSVHQATKVSRQNKKTSEATDLQETQLGAKSLKSSEICRKSPDMFFRFPSPHHSPVRLPRGTSSQDPLPRQWISMSSEATMTGHQHMFHYGCVH